jgi:bifunctional non-homologous end joining protein LigD
MTTTTSSAGAVPVQRQPMLPLQLCSSDPAAIAADPARWAWEVKWDGWRAQLHVRGGRATALWSRQGRSLTAAFPDALAAAAEARPGRDAVLDCELVVLDADSRPDFAAVTARGACASPRAAARAAAEQPAVLVVFDVLALDGQDLRPQPWQSRRDLLDGLDLDTRVARSHAPQLVCPSATDDGPGLWEATRALGLEGVVAKDRRAPYAAGRQPHWVKVKHPHARDLQPGAFARRTRSA